ncbi:MAG: DUF2059 domain-containing protein [Pseudorhodoplanes sp.]|nr:DUF2059 domain-containing protein [Pseudorhodoplanes sp.]MCQ3941839.1 hypothetical protein [Alphaproteobacteria bacterium]GIK81777.1 MAG: hypothetical protein BroJett024_28820 [Alphaproteobacteria bacterium]
MKLRCKFRSAGLAIVAMAVVAFAAPASAQQPSASAVATAKEILVVKGSLTMFEPIVPGVVEQVKNVLLQQSPNLQKELNDTATALRTQFTPKFEELREDIARLYASRFAEQELKDLLAFFKSPLGKKLLIEEANFVEQTLTRAQDWSNRLADEVMVSFRSEMKKKGHNL